MTGDLVEAIETDQQDDGGGGHHAIVALLQSGYKPTTQEWDALSRVPIGSAHKAATAERVDRKVRALRRYRELGRGMPVEARKRRIMEEFGLSYQEVTDYVVLQKYSRVVYLARKQPI